MAENKDIKEINDYCALCMDINCFGCPYEDKSDKYKNVDAPEKIYILPSCHDRWCKEILDDDNIEYVRADAFIEKAKKWLKKNADDYTWYDEMEGESGMTDEFVDDFVNYMKGE